MSPRRSPCPIAFGLDIFGDKWSLLIIRDMALYGRHCFGDFQEAGECIATNILSHRLKLLVAQKIIAKSRDPDNGSRRIYTLTEKGLDLLPILIEVIVWSAKYDPKSPVSSDYLNRALHHREELLAELREKASAAARTVDS